MSEPTKTIIKALYAIMLKIAPVFSKMYQPYRCEWCYREAEERTSGAGDREWYFTREMHSEKCIFAAIEDLADG